MRKGDAAECTIGVRDVVGRGQAVVTDAVHQRTPEARWSRTEVVQQGAVSMQGLCQILWQTEAQNAREAGP